MPRDHFRTLLCTYALTIAGIVACVAGFNYGVDPLQYYRIPSFYKPVYFSSIQRYQNAGLARTHKYDTVVVGSSLMENFLPSYVDRSWAVRSLKLAISGSTAHEQFLVLRQALRTGQVKRVIWGLDAPVFFREWNAVRDDQAPFPYYMYRRPAIANVEYLFSLDTLRFSLAALRGRGEPDLDKVDSWHAAARYGQGEVQKSWKHGCSAFLGNLDGDALSVPKNQLAQMGESIERNILSLVRAYPGVTFDLLFPPVSVLAYRPLKTGWLPFVVAFDREIERRLSDEPNVRVFDFQVDTVITHDLALYKDPIHFHQSVSEHIVDSIGSGSFRVLKGEMERNLARLIADVDYFNPCQTGDWTPGAAAATMRRGS